MFPRSVWGSWIPISLPSQGHRLGSAGRGLPCGDLGLFSLSVSLPWEGISRPQSP